MQKLDRKNPDRDHVAGFGTIDKNRSRHRMRTRTALRHARFDGLERIRNFRFQRAARTQTQQSARDHRLDSNAFTGTHVQHRRHARIVVAPVDVLWSERQVLRADLLSADGARDHQETYSSRGHTTHAITADNCGARLYAGIRAGANAERSRLPLTANANILVI
jgi:hypothetical protein